MDAMILAAGLGTRLRPITDEIPKPLIPVGGVPVLERIARRLIAAGADRLIINTHPLPDLIERFVHERKGFGVDVCFSHEAPLSALPLDTGGGLWQAREHLRGDAAFFLHNGDILTTAPLRQLYAAHSAARPLATLAVRSPQPTRYLLFDDQGLYGFAPRGGDVERTVRPVHGASRRFEFAGVHVLDPRVFDAIEERGTFSIVDVYLRLAAAGARIQPFPFEGVWTDIGTHEGLAAAERDAAAGLFDG